MDNLRDNNMIDSVANRSTLRITGEGNKNNTAILACTEGIPIVLEALKDVLGIQGQCPGITIVDYGCGNGYASLPVFCACVRLIRERHGDEFQIQVIYNDQPENDFDLLLNTVKEPDSLLSQPNVFISTVARNFYQPCLLTNSVSLGYCSYALHYLKHKPCDIPDAVFIDFATDARQRDAYQRQAERDYEEFLLNRAAELMPGGRLILVQYWGKPSKEGHLKLMNETWKGLMEDGTITQAEFVATNHVGYFRNEEEHRKPFKCLDSAVRRAGLQLVTMTTQHIKCPYRKRWSRGEVSTSEHARDYVSGLRMWSYSIFESGLSGRRSTTEKELIMDTFYGRLEDAVSNNPADYGNDYDMTYLVITKTQATSHAETS